MNLVVDTCDVCAGVQGPDHVHTCKHCGADAGRTALVVGDDDHENVFYCDEHCMAAGEGTLEEGGPSALILAARELKRKFEAAGVRWEAV